MAQSQTGQARTRERAAIAHATTQVYLDSDGDLDNATVYDRVARTIGVTPGSFGRAVPVGRSGARRSLRARDVRWCQQSLKSRQMLSRVAPGRWRLTPEGRKQLTAPARGFRLLGFSTDLGLALWGDCRDVLSDMDDAITLCLTSPCYPIRNRRAYGGVSEQHYVDWLCEMLSGVVRHLARGGVLAINIGQDVFEHRRPSRSLFLERLTLALSDRMGLSLMDRLVWHNPSKPPGPVEYASKRRCQLNVGYEFVLWFTNDVDAVCADNRRVLAPHSTRQQALIDQGGTDRSGQVSDGAYSLRPGRSYANPTNGRIPRNVMRFGHGGQSQRDYKSGASALGLPAHGAPMPLALARFLVRFLSPPGALVFDPMGGSMTTGLAAEMEGRRWVMSERYAEYVRGAAARFTGRPGLTTNPVLDVALSVCRSASPD